VVTSTGSRTGNPSGPRIVVRQRLLTLLDEIGPRGVGLVVAAAGSGKSTLLSTWAAGLVDSEVVQLTLGSSDNDASLFARRLLAAFDKRVDVEPGIESLVDSSGDALGTVFVDAFVRLLESQEGPVSIILDDVHVLAPSLAGDLDRLMTRLPHNARLILAARRDPPLATMPLVLDNRLTEIRGDDLAFTLDEAADLLSDVSRRHLDTPLVERLIDRTEGWAVGLQLAAVSMQRTADVTDFADRFTGSNRLVAEYLTDEILNEVDSELRNFMLRTSVLVNLDADLCDHVLLRTDSRSAIDKLERRSMFVTRHVSDDGPARYHQLFRDLLRYHLLQEHPDEINALHRRAADWYLQSGHAEQAIEHLLSAGEHGLAYATIRAHGRYWISESRSATLVRWLRIIEPEVFDEAVRIDLLAALVIGGRHADAIDLFRDLSTRGTLSAGGQVVSAAVFSLMARHDLPLSEAAVAAQATLDGLPRVDDASQLDVLGVGGADAVEVLASYTLAWCAFLDGEVASSANAFAPLLELPGMGNALWRVAALGSSALTHAWLGRIRDAERLALSSLELALETSAAQRTSTTHAHLALAMVMTARLDTERAHEHLRQALDRALQSGRSRDRELHRLLLATLLALTPAPTEAMSTLQAPVSQSNLVPLIQRGCLALEAHVWLMLEEPRRAANVVRKLGAPLAVPATIDVALALDDVGLARRLLGDWNADDADLRAAIGRRVREALVLDAESKPDAALRAIDRAVDLAAPEQLYSPFTEAPGTLQLVKMSGRRRNEPFIASLLESVNRSERPAANQRLVEPLTDRELSILEFLPSRAGNNDLAAELYISVNTLKTHLRHIYRKLDVPGRDGAVARASELGLL
jgi:LuxR family maltose regulon positive regulatory protein